MNGANERAGGEGGLGKPAAAISDCLVRWREKRGSIENHERNVSGRAFLFALTELVFRVVRKHTRRTFVHLYTYIYIYTRFFSSVENPPGGTDRRKEWLLHKRDLCGRPRGTRCFIHAAYLAGTFELFATTTTTAASTTIRE